MFEKCVAKYFSKEYEIEINPLIINKSNRHTLQHVKKTLGHINAYTKCPNWQKFHAFLQAHSHRKYIKMFDSNSMFRWPWLTCFWGHLDSMELDKTSTLPKGPVFGPMNTKDCKIYKDNFFLMGFSIFVFLHKCPAHIESTGRATRVQTLL